MNIAFQKKEEVLIMRKDSNLIQEIENLRLLLVQTVQETKDFNHSLVIKYSVLLDELIIKAQKGSTLI